MNTVSIPSMPALPAIPINGQHQLPSLSVEDLRKHLSNNLAKEEMMQLLAELLKRLEESGQVKGGERDRIAELLQKLALGTISASEMSELADALGVDLKTLEKMATGGSGIPQDGGGIPNNV